MKRDGWVVGSLVMLLGLAGGLGIACSSTAHRGEPFYAPPRLSEQDRQGERVFMKYCNQCHPGGEGGLGPAINDRSLPVAAIKAQVRAGLGAMPSFPAELIPDAQLDALTGFLVNLRQTGREEPALRARPQEL